MFQVAGQNYAIFEAWYRHVSNTFLVTSIQTHTDPLMVLMLNRWIPKTLEVLVHLMLLIFLKNLVCILLC